MANSNQTFSCETCNSTFNSREEQGSTPLKSMKVKDNYTTSLLAREKGREE